MKKSLSIICLIFTSIVYSQSINNGIYSTTKKDIGFTSEFFKFSNANTFGYLIFGCEGSGFGVGNYEIKNDSIYLKFKNCDFCDSGLKIEKIKGVSDSLRINLKIIAENEGFSGVNLVVMEKNIGFQSDSDGNIKKIFLTNDEFLTLRISTVGFLPIDIKIDKGISEINGTIALNNNWIYSQSENISRKIIKLDKKHITFLNNLKSITYEKLKNKIALKRLKLYERNQDLDFYLKYFLQN